MTIHTSRDSKLFSIIIPTFNRAKLLRRALDSVIAQNGWASSSEIIVVDNTSTDGTTDLLKEYSSVLAHVCRINNNGSIGYSRNVGAGVANGRILLFLDSDDAFHSDRLDSLGKYLPENLDEPVWLYNRTVNFMGERGRQPVFRSLSLTDPFLDLMTRGNAMVTSGTAISKKLFEDVGGFDEDRHSIGVEDFALWLKLTSKGYKPTAVPLALTYYSVTPHSSSRITRNYVTKTLRCYRRYGKNLEGKDRRQAQGMRAYTYARMMKASQDGISILVYRRLLVYAIRVSSKTIRLRSLYWLISSYL